MITWSAMLPLPIHFFWPLSTKASPSRRAAVSRPTASEPCAGSVRPNAPIRSRRAIAGSQRSRCSSSPSIAIDCIARKLWTPLKVPTLPSARASSAATRPAATLLIPGQP